MSALEALASGTPVVAWNSPVYSQLIEHGATGYLVEENNPRALAEGILEVSRHYQTYTEMSEEVRARVASYDWSVIVSKVKNRVEQIWERRR